MDKLYPPLINGTIPAFYSEINKNEVLSKLKRGQGYIEDTSDGYFITCQNQAINNESTFKEGKLLPLDPLDPDNKVFYYCGLKIDNILDLGSQQIAIVSQKTENNNRLKELEIVLLNDDWGNISKNKVYNIYFTLDKTIEVNRVDRWVESANDYDKPSCGIYLEPIEDNKIAEISIPFSMNRSVGKEDIKGFALKIKTIQTNSNICVLQQEKEDNFFLNNKVTFIIPDIHLEKIYPGQFLKVQLAYLYGKDEDIEIEKWDIGYYSTVGIIKYTNKPEIFIQELQNLHDDDIYPLLCKYTGKYMNSDNTEKPYQQKFSLYKNNELLETSDWFLYDLNSEENNNFNFQTLLLDENIQVNYSIQYDLKTINGLEENIIYNLLTPVKQSSEMPINLIAQNNFNDCYIKIFFKENGWSFTQYTTQINENQLEILNSDDQNDIFSEISENILNIINNNAPNNTQSLEVNENNILILKNIIFPFTNETTTEIKIYRADKTHNFKNWKEISSLQVKNFANIFDWNIRDFNIEQGERYQYAFKEYKNLTNNDEDSQLLYSNKVYADFEDCFLYDGKQQLKIRFNPQISSFKTNKLEQKIETIGNQFPFIFKNAIVNYKEFPISGLISYHMDDNGEFISKNDLDIISNNQLTRTSNPEKRSIKNIETLDLVDYNIKAERIFKLKVLDWLGNGEIKLFKSPTEGNYLVRLMNISLSPEKQLGRMLHNFSCTAYEVQEYNYKNLFKLNFFQNN